jgi:outer membrane protein assembly factor BamB/tetratricopeptide (TPR) repeat protein
MSSESSAELLSRSHREAARRLSTFPVAGPELLYVQFDRQVVALHRNTGAPAWRFDSGSAGEEADSFLDDRPPSWNSPTLQDGRLFAALPADQSSYYDTDVEHNGPELVCLNAGTGAHLWSAGAERFEIKPSDFVLDSSPLVAHGRVHIVARRRRSFGFEDSYLYTLRAVDGAVQSRVHLGGASTATFGSRTVTFAIPALHDDTVYVCNGLGSIAAVSAYTGGLQWLTTYDRFRETDTGVPGIAARDLVPWQFNPIIYSNARLVALPTDSRSILVLSETGDVERAVPRESVGQMQTLLGVHEGRICGAGDAIVCFDLSDATKQWSARLPPDQELFGRASMTRDTIWAPTRRALVRFSIGPGKRSEFAWSGKGEGGNVLVLPDSIIVAEPGALAAYGERERIWTSLRERIVAAPNDPLPPLEFAEVAFGVGELDEAVKALQLADKRLAASASADMESVRRRLFTDALTFAQSATSREGTTAIQEFFEIGARQAWDQESNVRYRLRFAEVFDAAGEPTRSAALCQQVLRDRGLRQYPMGNEATSAGQVAELRIAALIDRYGRTVYNDIEEMATEALQVASAARDREAILEVVHTFPNSQTATRALTALGDRHAAEGEFDDARRAYTRAFHRDAPAAERAALIAQIAEMCVKAQKPRDAYLWLSKGALQYPTATVKYDGRRRGFIELRDRMSKESPVVLASRPHLEPPLRESGRRSLDQGARLLTPVLSAPSQGSRTYFIATPLTITAHSARSGAPLWPQPATPPAAAELLVQLDHLAILATKYQVFALDLATGSVAWSMGHEPPHVADPGADWEKGGAVLSHARQDHLLVSARDNGVFTGIDIRDGKVTWSRTMAAPAGAVQLSLPWLVYPTAEGDNNRVKVVDGASGQAVGEIALDGRRPVESLVVTFDGLLLAVTSKSIDCYELETRRPRWSAAIGGQLQLETLQLTPDGVVYADSGRQLRKLSIDDGRELWASASVGNDDSDGLRVEVVEDQLLALTATSVAAIDGVTGVTLWTGAVPDDVRFVRHLMTDDFLATVHTPRGDSKQPMVYLYNLHTGRIPASGGTVEFSNGVGAIENILAVDGTLLLQSADALHAFISSGD